MIQRKVPVERCIEQVRDGSHYKGYMTIAGTTLDYELTFLVPIPKLKDMTLDYVDEESRRLFQLTVKRSGANVELTNDEYGLFLYMLLEFAVGFYNNPRTRNRNKGMMGLLLRSRGPLAAFGVSVLIGTKKRDFFTFPIVVCQMLSAPKFGCVLNP